MLRVGVLLPRSSLFPALGLDILNGIKSCLKYNDVQGEYSFLTDNIGFGIEEAEIYTKAERMLLQEEADLVVVVADLNIKELLEPLFTSFNKILMIVNMGAGIPDNWSSGPTTIVHSLNFSLQARLTGKLAALENENKKGACTLSYYDAGYRQVYAMMNSFQLNGGEPQFTHVTHLKKEEYTLDPLTEFCSQNPELQSLLCLFSGDMADWFTEAVLPLQEKFKLNLYASPMLLEAYQARTAAGHPSGTALKGYTAWVPELKNAGNEKYKQAFTAMTNKAPGLFGVLGWDAGLLILDIHEKIKSGETNMAIIVKAITAKVYESPRGWMKLDPATHHTYAPCQLISWSGNGAFRKVEECKELDEEWSAFTAEKFPPDTNSGWRNTFLCI